MIIQLHLENHCIETEIKRCHDAAMSRYFKDERSRNVAEAELVLLEKAMAYFDFPHLRSKWPVLAGGSKISVCLTVDDTGQPCICFEHHTIIPPRQER